MQQSCMSALIAVLVLSVTVWSSEKLGGGSTRRPSRRTTTSRKASSVRHMFGREEKTCPVEVGLKMFENTPRRIYYKKTIDLYKFKTLREILAELRDQLGSGVPDHTLDMGTESKPVASIESSVQNYDNIDDLHHKRDYLEVLCNEHGTLFFLASSKTITVNIGICRGDEAERTMTATIDQTKSLPDFLAECSEKVGVRRNEYAVFRSGEFSYEYQNASEIQLVEPAAKYFRTLGVKNVKLIVKAIDFYVVDVDVAIHFKGRVQNDLCKLQLSQGSSIEGKELGKMCARQMEAKHRPYFIAKDFATRDYSGLILRRSDGTKTDYVQERDFLYTQAQRGFRGLIEFGRKAHVGIKDAEWISGRPSPLMRPIFDDMTLDDIAKSVRSDYEVRIKSDKPKFVGAIPEKDGDRVVCKLHLKGLSDRPAQYMIEPYTYYLLFPLK